MRLGRRELAVLKPASEERFEPMDWVGGGTIRHHRRHVRRPCAPKNEPRQYRKNRGKGEEGDPLRLEQHQLLNVHERDEREHHRENSDRLDDTQRGEIIREPLIGLGLSVTRGGAGATLEERRKPNSQPREDAGNQARNARTGDARFPQHDEH